MIGLVPEPKHAAEFDRRFDQLFAELSGFARSKGIARCCATGGSCSAEDPDDFAQECLLQYSIRARRAGFRNVQTSLIKRIARDRLVDAWRKRGRMPKREDFDRSTKETTENAGSNCDCSAIPELQGLSDKAVEILRLKHIAQWRDCEIAAALGMTVDGVRSSLKRSRQGLLTKRVTAVR